MRNSVSGLSLRATVLFVLATLLASCAGGAADSPSDSSEGSSLAYSRLKSVQAGTATDQLELESLVTEFDSRDDVFGGWLASFELCRLNANAGSAKATEAACAEALARAELSGSRSALFDTAMQLYFYTQDSAYLRLAETAALSEEDQHVLALARGEYSGILLPEQEHSAISVRAYQYYWFGKSRGDVQALQEAYRLFSRAGNSRGMADALFVQARLAHRAGQADRSRDLALRSEKVLRSIGELEKADVVVQWIARELAAQ
ncbi:MAG: hypothetical protein V7746_19630 [Halioglobus sp.]